MIRRINIKRNENFHILSVNNVMSIYQTSGKEKNSIFLIQFNKLSSQKLGRKAVIYNKHAKIDFSKKIKIKKVFSRDHNYSIINCKPCKAEVLIKS